MKLIKYKINSWVIGIFIFLFLNPIIFADDDSKSLQQQCENWGVNQSQAKYFAESIQHALNGDDKNSLANFVSYPLTIYRWKKSDLIIHNKKQFLENYNSIFDNKIKDYLLKSNPNFFVCNYHGVGMANGTIWFFNTSFKIFEMNIW